MKTVKYQKRFEIIDYVFFIILILFGMVILFPFVNVIAISFSTSKEYLNTPLMLFPSRPTLENYMTLIKDGRIWIGYRTTTLILMLGVPVNLFFTTSIAYALGRQNFFGKKVILYIILFTMLFNGGIIPMYLLMMELKLINSIWSVVLATGINTFYMIIMRNYFSTLPESLIESAKLDGAGVWQILFKIILPLSMPIIATITLFYSVDRWNEWFNAMIFVRKNNLITLQLVLRSIVIDSKMQEAMNIVDEGTLPDFTDGMKMSAVIITMLPIMCVFPFLQKYFVKGVLIGAIKA